MKAPCLRCAAEPDEDVALDVVDVKRGLAGSSQLTGVWAPRHETSGRRAPALPAPHIRSGNDAVVPIGAWPAEGEARRPSVQHVALHGAEGALAGAGQTSTSRCILTSSASCAGWVIGPPSIVISPSMNPSSAGNFQMQAQDAGIFAVGGIGSERLARAARATTRRRSVWWDPWDTAMRCTESR